MPAVITGNGLAIITVLNKKPDITYIGGPTFHKRSDVVEYMRIIPKARLQYLQDKKKHFFIHKFVPRGTNLVQDTANFRIKLVGRKTLPEWIPIKKNYIKGLGRTKKAF